MNYTLETLLDLNGYEYYYESGFRIKYEAWRARVSEQIPHGIRYSLTLHDETGQRIFGIDNAHGIKPSGKSFRAQIVAWDHKHQREQVTAYSFTSVEQLMDDFENAVDAILEVSP